MKPLTSLLFFTLCCLPLLTLAAEPVGQELVTKLCGQTKNPEFCVSSFGNVQNDIEQANVTGVVLFGLKVASKNASDISMLIKSMLNDPGLSPQLQQVLEDCSDYYVDAVDLLDDSVAALLANAYRDVRTWVSAAVIDVTGCQEALKKQKGSIENDLTQKTDTFLQLCDNGLVFLNQLEPQ
ncbi:hypothetical protein ACFE04_020526 [Oxalis oulophora]